MGPKRHKHHNAGHQAKALPSQQFEHQYAATANCEIDPNFQAHFSAPPPRSDTELNITVLQRYNPEVEELEHIAPYGVVYEWSTEQSTWEKCGIEGSVFICKLRGNQESDERYTIIVLNRRQLHNLDYELRSEAEVEFTDEYIILVDTLEGQQKIRGLWIFAEPSPSSTASQPKEVAEKIKECLRRAEEGRGLKIASAMGHNADEETAQEAYTGGRQLDVQELFRLTGTNSFPAAQHVNQQSAPIEAFHTTGQNTYSSGFPLAGSQIPSASVTPSLFPQSADTAFFLSSQRGAPAIINQPSPQPSVHHQSETNAGGVDDAQRNHLLNLFRQAGSST